MYKVEPRTKVSDIFIKIRFYARSKNWRTLMQSSSSTHLFMPKLRTVDHGVKVVVEAVAEDVAKTLPYVGVGIVFF